uniref:Uncharacterized protein n=1 Tax=Knipowitschia caucasica TaxID=637954 RepID=A0AAV2KHL7_KNICA
MGGRSSPPARQPLSLHLWSRTDPTRTSRELHWVQSLHTRCQSLMCITRLTRRPSSKGDDIDSIPAPVANDPPSPPPSPLLP